MARDEPEIDYVDYTSIHFPSDRLAIADLRRLYPAEFDEKGPPVLPVVAVRQQLGLAPVPLEHDWFLDQLRAMPLDQTIRHLRRQYPDLFDVEGGYIEDERLNTHYESSHDVSGMLWLERSLARIAYHEAFGNPRAVGPWPSGIELPERDGYRDDLAKLYEKFGLARGKNEARALIARFEGDAAAQAAPGRPPQRER